ncbi:GntR family transcriptional regulator [Tundrisphaera sp. TA3]|uniref:GntR family transcriptional regulator n=1 Tax=Tundrisphaera sp. TA3 TaxID=3435775 RepID=UPI003EB97C98
MAAMESDSAPGDDCHASASDISRDCTRVTIRRALVQRITDGTYAPGDRLLELKLAKEFGTSQGPVREALRELEGMRLVSTERYRGSRVRAVSREEMVEAAWVRGHLEAEAATLSAPSLAGNVGALREMTDALIVAAREGRLDDYARHNEDFHRFIMLAAGNEVLLRTWDSLLLEARTRLGIEHVGDALIPIAETHVPIVDALERGDGELAGQLLREHADLLALDPTDPRVVQYASRGVHAPT